MEKLIPRKLLDSMILIACFLSLCFALLYGLAMKNGGPVLDRLFRSNKTEVASITLTPSSDPYGCPFKKPIILTDKEHVGEFLKCLRKSKSFSPNHPSIKWECYLDVSSGKESSFATITKTNQGTLIWVHSDRHDGWNLGTYVNDGLEELLLEYSRKENPQ